MSVSCTHWMPRLSHRCSSPISISNASSIQLCHSAPRVPVSLYPAFPRETALVLPVLTVQSFAKVVACLSGYKEQFKHAHLLTKWSLLWLYGFIDSTSWSSGIRPHHEDSSPSTLVIRGCWDPACCSLWVLIMNGLFQQPITSLFTYQWLDFDQCDGWYHGTIIHTLDSQQSCLDQIHILAIKYFYFLFEV